MPAAPPAHRSLLGTTIGVTADRRWQEQASLLERRGATVVHGPSIHTLPVELDEGLRSATAALVARPPDVVVLTTGLGMRSWLAAAESVGVGEDLLDVLARTEVLARGPKAAGAALTAGLDVAWRAPTERSADLVAHLLDEGVAGRRVAVQLDGGDDVALVDALTAAGADVVPVRVYRWTMPSDEAPALRLAEAACGRRLDAVTFTSGPALSNLVDIARRHGMADELLAALCGPVLAMCVGPVCADTARRVGITAPAEPIRPRMGSMVQALGERLATSGRHLVAGDVHLVLRAGTVLVDGTAVDLADRERAVLDVLAVRPGVVVAKETLLRRVWGDGATDTHAVEVTVARLRRRLGPAGGAVETAVRRGYRLVAQHPPSPGGGSATCIHAAVR